MRGAAQNVMSQSQCRDAIYHICYYGIHNHLIYNCIRRQQHTTNRISTFFPLILYIAIALNLRIIYVKRLLRNSLHNISQF